MACSTPFFGPVGLQVASLSGHLPALDAHVGWITTLREGGQGSLRLPLKWGVPWLKLGYPYDLWILMVGLFHGKSHLEMDDDDLGVPLWLRKPPNGKVNVIYSRLWRTVVFYHLQLQSWKIGTGIIMFPWWCSLNCREVCLVMSCCVLRGLIFQNGDDYGPLKSDATVNI